MAIGIIGPIGDDLRGRQAFDQAAGRCHVVLLAGAYLETVVSALVALSFLAGVVAPASAESFSIKTLDQDNRGGHAYSGSVIEELDKEGRGGHNT